MTRRLLTVEEPFTIEGRGVCLSPVLVIQDDEAFQIGDPIDIRHPDGRVVRTNIAALELPYPNPDHGWIIMLPQSIKIGDIPVGSEVWSVDS
jgi:hypothetical protein